MATSEVNNSNLPKQWRKQRMDFQQYVLTGLVSIVTAFISYFAAIHKGKIDLKAMYETNKAEI